MRRRVRRGDPQRRSYWQDVLRRWSEGRQSVRAFCRAEGLQESAFYFWRRKLGDHARKQPEPTSPGPAFLPVQLVHDGPAEAVPDVEIVLPLGRTVRVRPGFDRQTLAAVLSVLEARPC